ncbi:hypothetical protein HWV62_45164 [Athelia sp. TMB]|nr:hypothetical protein HWV62_45164 [Athelia sp. TMB]
MKGFAHPPTSAPASRGNRILISCIYFFLVLLVLVEHLPSASAQGYLNGGDLSQREAATRHGKRLEVPEVLFTDNNRTDQVQWDSYSMLLRGQRIFLYSGEFHTFRLPVLGLWLDILQKIKAAGLNAISVYTHAGLLNPSPGVTDLTGIRALQPLFDAAKLAGVWVVLRPGPYINAETSAGGLPHWMTSELSGVLRTNSSDYFIAWQDYIHAIIEVAEINQITNGGPVIDMFSLTAADTRPTPAVQVDNEYSQSSYTDAYFVALETAYHSSNIVVPLTFNDPGQHKDFVNGTGAVDIYGLDSYPQGFDCSHATKWAPVVTNYYDYHMRYEQCQILTGAAFENVFYQNLWAANAKMISFYMVYGGTSWGALPYPGVYTSYDYGSAISENRNLSAKYRELKRQGLFLRSSPDFYKTDWVGNSTSGVVTTNDSAIFSVLLHNPDTDASFYIVRQADATSTSTVNFQMNVTASTGEIKLPQIVNSITIGGRQSKVIVTNYSFGNSSLLYSTAQVLFAGCIGQRDVVFLYGDIVQEHEASLSLTGTLASQYNVSGVSFTSVFNQTIIGFNGVEGFVTVYESSEQLVLFADTDTAGTFWNPVIPASPDTEFSNYWQLGSNTSILVGGPYLVRNATVSGSNLALTGDLDASIQLVVVANQSFSSVTWNGEQVSADPALSTSTVFIGQLNTKTPTLSIQPPTLDQWKYSNSLPEILGNYSDDSWAVANHTTTNIPFKPYYGDAVLYGCDYGFCENIVLWRGHFNATGSEKSMNLSINGGEAFAASVWVNNIFLNTSYGNSSDNRHILEETDDQFYFPEGSLNIGQDNVVTVVQDNMGLNETGCEKLNLFSLHILTRNLANDAAKSPRGIRGFNLDSGNFTGWKVQGKLGGYTNYPDKTRGVFNEGGLYGERQGWHLPGFDTTSWESRNLSSGLPDSAAGVGFFVTTFYLDIPENQDAFLSFNFDNGTLGQPYRAYLFVNGWMMGKRVGNLGSVTFMKVFRRVSSDLRGIVLSRNSQCIKASSTIKAKSTCQLCPGEPISNQQSCQFSTVAVALWAMELNVTVNPTLEVTVDAVLEGGVGGIIPDNPQWTSRASLLA